MKDSPARLLLLATASCLLTATSSKGAILWVDGVLATPTSHIAADPAAITDQTNVTGWSGVTLAANETLTLTWDTAFFNDGTGVIQVTSTVRLHPSPSGSSFDIRFLLSDGSYSDQVSIAAQTGVKRIDKDTKQFVSLQTVGIAGIYSGPLAIKGIELTNLNLTSDGAGGFVNESFSLLGLNAVVPVPEPSSSLLALGGVALMGMRRRRAAR
ncbi:PEP-CTERM sorting domain-containing protein [Luteolibacter sp. Populi]|uniref:PEP-CTERM sorting domain-containing protein n=1 Tax=Luteolibacter sp. Populi TaxID=3230487 RepID=UPI00346693A5